MCFLCPVMLLHLLFINHNIRMCVNAEDSLCLLCQVSPPGSEGGHSQHSLWDLPCQETERERRSAPDLRQRDPGKQPVVSQSVSQSADRLRIKKQCNEAVADESIVIVTTASLHAWKIFKSVKISVFSTLPPHEHISNPLRFIQSHSCEYLDDRTAPDLVPL